MPDYSHLQSKAFESRYVMAGHYLSNADRIAEVGGQRLTGFLSSETLPSRYWGIDPCGENDTIGHYQNFAMPITAFEFRAVRNGTSRVTGLCLLGLELFDGAYGEDDGANSIAALCAATPEFDIVVMDFVPSNDLAYQQATMLHGACTATGLKLDVELDLRCRHDDKYVVGQKTNESFFKQRIFRVYTNGKLD